MYKKQTLTLFIMNIDSGREFSFTNPQDNPELYPTPPKGFGYDLDGHLIALPKIPSEKHLLRNPYYQYQNDTQTDTNTIKNSTPSKSKSDFLSTCIEKDKF